MQCLGSQTILLVGNLKVGKSTLFSSCIGRKKSEITYPNSSVVLTYGKLSAAPFQWMIDSPGFYSLQEHSEDAFVVRDLLTCRKVGAVLVVLDAKNIRRGLLLAFELAEFQIPVAVTLNMCDEASLRGVQVDHVKLAQLLGVPVVPTIATEARDLGQIKKALWNTKQLQIRLDYPELLNAPVKQMEGLLKDRLRLSVGGLIYLLLADVRPAKDLLSNCVGPALTKEVLKIRDSLNNLSQQPIDIVLTRALQRQSEEIASQVVQSATAHRTTWSERLGPWTRKPLSGTLLALVVMVLVYLFVGEFGAGFLVGIFEGKLFNELINPLINSWVNQIPWSWMREMLIGDFGILTVGLTLSLAVVLPVLSTFFFAFAVLENSGYLSRLSLLMDRGMRKIGLNGKAVLPLMFGFSCVTMAVLSTRILSSRKQRIIATLLLMLAFPCAPLLAVIMVVLSKLSLWATVAVFGTIGMQFLLVGFLANRLIPGGSTDFVLELPPLRIPRLKIILLRTGHQITWFLKDAIPYFLLGAFIMFLMDQFGVLEVIRNGMQVVLKDILDLPPQSADAFLMAMVRRELGAAELARQFDAGNYNGVQIAVTLVVMTLMIPCINSVLVMFKERKLMVSVAILFFVFSYALLVGGLFNAICQWLRIRF